MKRKTRKFAEGGLSDAQKEWLGGADATDPYILARMRAAVPDEVVKESVADVPSEPKAVEKTVVKTKVAPVKKITGDDTINPDVKIKKPYIDIPERAAGMSQFRSDAVSPAERLWKSLTETKSQRSKAAGMKKGGFVDHADHVKQHAAGFKPHNEHVKAMCGGGMTKKKK